MRRFGGLVFSLLMILVAVARTASASDPGEGVKTQRQRLVKVAAKLLEEGQVSYVYGGYQKGDSEDCARCNSCLAKHQPAPKLRLKLCPGCAACSLDCSHFLALVFQQAGLPYPYLPTASMLGLDAAALRRQYGLIDLGSELRLAAAGDMLVYDGHVVMLEKAREPMPGRPYRGDVVHATSGRDVRGPGEGIQRERFVDLASFRGPLRRILRHQGLAVSGNGQAGQL